MKKMLLFVAALFSVATVCAQSDFEFEEPTWTKNLTDVVEKASDANVNAPVIITNQGDVIKTGTFNMAFTFAGETLEPIAKSAYVLKYDKMGNEVWGVALQGAATITAATADDEGNIYVAGVFADVVNIKSTDGNSTEIKGMEDMIDQVSGFIVVYDKDGKMASYKTVIPETNMELFYTALANEGFYMNEPHFRINKIVVDGEKVYFSTRYAGNCKIDDVQLEGKIFDMYGMNSFCFDLYSFAAISLDKSLNNASLLANVFTSDDVLYGELQMQPQAMKFAVDGDDVFVVWTGWGDLTMNTAKGSENFSFAVEGEAQEHAYVVANVTKGETTVFHAPATDKLASFFTVSDAQVVEDKFYVSGTFIGSLAFDNSKTSTGACDAFLASIHTADLTLDWAQSSGINEGEENKYNEVALGLDANDFGVATMVNTIDMNSKEISQTTIFGYVPMTGQNVILDVPFIITANSISVAGSVFNTNIGTESTLRYFADEDFTQGIETIDNSQLTISNDAIYNLQGQRVNKVQKGVFIQNGKKVVVR